MKDSVKVIVYDADGWLLVLRRSASHPTLGLHPDLPGGEVDSGESIAEAAQRELYEEAGFEMPLDSLCHEGTERTWFGTTRSVFSVQLDLVQPDVAISWEHDQYDWMTVYDFVRLEKPVRPDDFLDITRHYVSRLHNLQLS